MTRFNRRTSDRGVVLWAETDRGGVISAHYGADRSSDRPFTIFWRARISLKQLNEFFGDTYPRSEGSVRVSATGFGPNDRIRLDGLRNSEELYERLPEDIRFVRLECQTRPEPDTMLSLEYVVWSRVDLHAVPRGEPAPTTSASSSNRRIFARFG
jgi:hypothetical protein